MMSFVSIYSLDPTLPPRQGYIAAMGGLLAEFMACGKIIDTGVVLDVASRGDAIALAWQCLSLEGSPACELHEHTENAPQPA